MEKVNNYIRYIEWFVPGWDQKGYPPAINGQTEYHILDENQPGFEDLLNKIRKYDPSFEPKTKIIIT